MGGEEEYLSHHAGVLFFSELSYTFVPISYLYLFYLVSLCVVLFCFASLFYVIVCCYCIIF